MWYLIVLLLVPAMAFAESQTTTTDGGRLEIRMIYPDQIQPGVHVPILIEFINPQTGQVQEHIDYTLSISNASHTLFGPTNLIHSTEGVLRSLEPAFQEVGDYTIHLEIDGILFQPIETEAASLTIQVREPPGGGCLIATAVYGSEMAPQIQHLREIRDNILLSTEAGRSFMDVFNPVYYWFSPAIADMERQNAVFRAAVGGIIQPMIWSLHVMEHADTEEKVIVYGAGIILLNGMMYLGPVTGVVWLQRRLHSRFSLQAHTNV